jgi:flagellar protein FliO/FliZ
MDLTTYFKFVLALLFVLSLIGAAAMVARRFGLGHSVRRSTPQRRLAVLEVLPLDGKRRLILLRRDEVEHLIVLGPTSETVLERVPDTDARTFGAALREQAAIDSQEALQ